MQENFKKDLKDDIRWNPSQVRLRLYYIDNTTRAQPHQEISFSVFRKSIQETQMVYGTPIRSSKYTVKLVRDAFGIAKGTRD